MASHSVSGGPEQASDDDTSELAQLGYAQTLQRSMGPFSSFALAFSLISINTGIFANFQVGIQQVGPAMVWSWLLVLGGQLLVALVLAELVTLYPVSGYGYQWASRLANPHYGFFVGWLLLLQLLTGFPGVCATFTDCARMLWDLPFGGPPLTVLVIGTVAAIHLLGIRWASRINDLGVIAEILGAACIVGIFLIVLGPASSVGASILADTTNFQTQAPATLPAFALSLLMGAWCLTGFEASADLAEETHSPRGVIPRAMISSLLISGGVGFLMIVGFLLAIKDLKAVQSAPQPLLFILNESLGPKGTRWGMLVVLVSIFACAVANMAATSRLFFSLARDNMLPFSARLKAIDPARHTPSVIIILVACLSSAIVLWFEKLAIITSISATAGYLGYAGIIIAGLMQKESPPHRNGVFGLGKWSKPVRAAALVWTLGLVLALALPDTGDGHLPAKTTAVSVSAGVLLYAFLIRQRIVEERAGPPAVPSKEPENA